MAYRVCRVKRLKGPQWKVRWESIVGGARNSRDVPKHEWAALGFRLDMTWEQACEWRDGLNAKERLRRSEAKRQTIAVRLSEESDAQDAFLPRLWVEEFERRKLLGRSRHPQDKTPSYWNVAKRLLCELRLEPEEWEDEATQWYDAFSARGDSPAYVQKLIQVLNRWGAFVCKKRQAYFAPLPYPTARERTLIQRANQKKKVRRGNKTSAPLTPKALESKESELRPEHYAALYLTVWLGLRPHELECLRSPKEHRWERVGNVDVLWVFQPKVADRLGDARAWKPIPLFRPEQRKCRKFIEQGAFRLPLAKTIASHFGAEFGQYAGRKGFTDLMLSLGQSLEDISVWMGHSSIERTWQSYKNKQAVRFTAA